MAQYVERMIEHTGRALTERDARLSLAVIDQDSKVDRAGEELDVLCLQILAEHQATIPDVRWVTLAMKMATDLERIAELTVDACGRAAQLPIATTVVPVELPEACAAVETMVRDATAAFLDRDVDKAEAIAETHEVVDRHHQRIFEELLQRMPSEPGLLPEWIHVHSIVQWLHRMAAHSAHLVELTLSVRGGHDAQLSPEPHDEWPEDFRACLGAWPEPIERLDQTGLEPRDPFE